ncbi:MAG: glycoside hydrolase family 2 TIM barrel-domain containing protein [bacterium]
MFENKRFFIVLLISVISFSLLSVNAESRKDKDVGNRSKANSSNHELSIKYFGTEKIIDYEKYGKFKGTGTDNYKYAIDDIIGLKRAAGTGIYPDSISVFKEPLYKKLKKEKSLSGDKWDFIHSDNYAANIYKWASCEDEDIEGVKQWFTAFALERAGLLDHAIKAYYAIIVHFPKSVGWTFFNTPWYQGRAAVDKVDLLCRQNPKLGMKLVDCEIKIINGYNNETGDDIFYVRPGKLIKVDPEQVLDKRINLSSLTEVRKIGRSDVQLIKYNNNHWQLILNNKPFVVKAVAYSPNKVGLSPDSSTLTPHKDYMKDDYNSNGKIDGPYDAWVDKNGNNLQDEDETAVGDFRLMKEMGVNAVRLYHHVYNKELLMDLYNNYGIMALIGDYLGMYSVGSDAPFSTGTDYSNEEYRKNMVESVKSMVVDNKDEPYVLMWILGNENNYSADPVTYYKFVNEVAKIIKSIDPNHPVAICNGDFLFLDLFAKYCPDIDIYGTNSYRGKDGFGLSLWKGVSDLADKAVLITEYGCPAYHSGKSFEIAEDEQSEYHEFCWKDIMYNTAGSGYGNSIGGVVFEWCDEWWKNGNSYNADKHDEKGKVKGPYPDGWLYEEWLGICGQGDGKNSPFLRHLRKVYYTYQKIWNE